MVYFELTQWELLILAFFGGCVALGLIILGYYAWRLNLSARQDRETLTQEDEHKYPHGYEIENKPIPLILILVFVTVVLWGIAYAILVATGVFDVS